MTEGLCRICGATRTAHAYQRGFGDQFRLGRYHRFREVTKP